MAESITGQFVADVIAAAREAEEARPATIQRLLIAGVRLDLHYAGDALLGEFGPALAHLEVEDDGASAVVVRLWDTATTGIPVPPPPLGRESFTDRGDLTGLEDPDYRAAFHWSEYSVCVLDIAAGEAAYWVSNASHLPYWAKSSPLRTILGWVLDLHGVQLLHAAAVATPEGAVLITGGGGTGKSTTALTCFEAGLDFLGDDYVAVSLDPPTVHSLYATAKIADTTHPALASIPTMAARPGDEKVVLKLHPAAGGRLVRSAPLRAIVTPEVNDRETTDVAEVERDRLEHAATLTTLAQLPHTGSAARARIGRLLDELPSGLLRLGRDRAGVVEAVRLLAAGTRVSTTPSVDDGLPFVTVVIPVHNGAHFLASAVDSILAQHYPRLEIVVVDDGSQDDLESAIAALPVDVRVQHQGTSGPAAARNRGVAIATSELVAFLDVDDIWPHGALITLVRDWLHGGAPVVIGRAQVVTLNTETGDEVAIDDPATTFPYYIGSAVYERSVFDRIGGFDATMRYGEDTDWFARLAESGEVLRRLSTVTLVVRRHGQNMTEGLDLVELNVVRAIKKSLDRKRNRGDAP